MQPVTRDLGLYKVTKESIQGINLLVYGYQGSGKTMLAASAQDHEELSNVLFLNIEGGLMSVANREDILAIDIKSTEHIQDIFRVLVGGGEELKGVNTVVIDSVTELQTMNLEEIARTRSSNKDMITREDYMKSTTMLKRLLRLYRDLPLNVIYTAIPKAITPNQGEGAPTEIRPSLTASLCDSVMGYVDLVWYLYATEKVIEEGETKSKVTVRRLLTQERGIYRGKTRDPEFAERLGPMVEDPNLPEIYDLWRNGASE